MIGLVALVIVGAWLGGKVGRAYGDRVAARIEAAYWAEVARQQAWATYYAQQQEEGVTK